MEKGNLSCLGKDDGKKSILNHRSGRDDKPIHCGTCWGRKAVACSGATLRFHSTVDFQKPLECTWDGFDYGVRRKGPSMLKSFNKSWKQGQEEPLPLKKENWHTRLSSGLYVYRYKYLESQTEADTHRYTNAHRHMHTSAYTSTHTDTHAHICT